MRIFVGSVDSRYGVRLFASHTKRELEAQVAKHVRGDLLLKVDGAPDPQFAGLGDAAVIRKYFRDFAAAAGNREWYNSAEVEVLGGPAAADGRPRGRSPRLLHRLGRRPPASGGGHAA